MTEFGITEEELRAIAIGWLHTAGCLTDLPWDTGLPGATGSAIVDGVRQCAANADRITGELAATVRLLAEALTVFNTRTGASDRDAAREIATAGRE